MTNEEHAKIALILLRKAMKNLKAAGSVRTVAKLRSVIKSADGAVRAAAMRDHDKNQGWHY